MEYVYRYGVFNRSTIVGKYKMVLLLISYLLFLCYIYIYIYIYITKSKLTLLHSLHVATQSSQDSEKGDFTINKNQSCVYPISY